MLNPEPQIQPKVQTSQGSLSKQVAQRLIKIQAQCNKGELPCQLVDPQFQIYLQTQVDRISQTNNQKGLQIANNNSLTLSIIKSLCQLLNQKISQKSNDQKIYKSQGSTKILTLTPDKKKEMKMFLYQQLGQIKAIASLLKEDNFSDALGKTKAVSQQFVKYGHQQVSSLLISYVYYPVLEGLSQRANQLKQMLLNNAFIQNKIKRIQSFHFHSQQQSQSHLKQENIKDNSLVVQNGDTVSEELMKHNKLQRNASARNFQTMGDFQKSQKSQLVRKERAQSNYYEQKRQQSDKLFSSIRNRIDEVSSISQKMSKIKENLKNRSKQIQTTKFSINKTFNF